jgi:hypothetical protein
MRKKFKMAVISIVLLITGGILLSCGKKEEKTTEVTTEVTTTTEATTQASTVGSTVEIDGYKFTLPEGFNFSSQNDEVFVYNKVTENYDMVLSIYTEPIFENFEDITEDRIHNMMRNSWLMGGTEGLFQYEERNRNKIAYYASEHKTDNRDIAKVVSYLLLDPVKDKMVSMTYMTGEIPDDNEAKQASNEIFESFEAFEANNF